MIKAKATIFPTLKAANHAMPDCPLPIIGGGGGHWWDIDHEKLSEQLEADEGMEKIVDHDFVPCICTTCKQRMLLSAFAEEYPTK